MQAKQRHDPQIRVVLTNHFGLPYHKGLPVRAYTPARREKLVPVLETLRAYQEDTFPTQAFSPDLTNCKLVTKPDSVVDVVNGVCDLFFGF